MTRAEALTEARLRFGPTAYVHRHRKPNGVVGQYQVGRAGPEGPYAVYYHGDSWEEAFADASRSLLAALGAK